MKKLIVAIVFMLLMSPVFALSPPWSTLQQKIKVTFGNNPNVVVGELQSIAEGQYAIDIQCKTIKTAEGLAFTLKQQFKMGNVIVFVNIFDPEGNKISPPLTQASATLEETQKYLVQGLRGNKNFTSSFISTSPSSLVQIETRARVLQFWNDNLSDPNGYAHGIAAEMFNSLLVKGLKANFYSSIEHR